MKIKNKETTKQNYRKQLLSLVKSDKYKNTVWLSGETTLIETGKNKGRFWVSTKVSNQIETVNRVANLREAIDKIQTLRGAI